MYISVIQFIHKPYSYINQITRLKTSIRNLIFQDYYTNLQHFNAIYNFQNNLFYDNAIKCIQSNRLN